MTLSLPKDKFGALEAALRDAGFSFEERPHQAFLARKDGVTVNAYNSGKVVITPPNSSAARQVEALVSGLGASRVEKKARAPGIEIQGTRVGTDEVGKGDYLGPLVVAGVMVTEAQAERLRELGVRDSKALSETSIANLAVGIRRVLEPLQIHVATISPVKYNLLMAKERNVNSILGWAHAQVLENVLTFKERCKIAVADQFGDQSYIENALKPKGREVELIQMPHAESEISVAAASIIAREASNNALKALSNEYGMPFPRGAGTNVDEFARKLAATYGEGVLLATAKVHFANTQRVAKDLAELERNLGELRKESASSNPQANTRVYLELYSLISSFETEVRHFLQSRLTEVAGESWWEKRVPQSIQNAAERLRDEERGKGREVPLIECLGLHEYRRIIVNEENWKEIFAKVFEGDEKGVNAHFGHLYDIRNPVAHRRTLRQDDIYVALGSIRWLRARMFPH